MRATPWFARLALVPTLVGALVLSVSLVAAPAQAQKIKPDFWGMHDKEWTSFPTVAVGAANLTTSGTYWTSVERTEGVFDFSRLDAQVRAAERAGAQPMIVLGSTPRFHSTKPESADYNDYMPKMKAWKRWVKKVGKKYGKRLDYQIWPEPNIIENWKDSQRQMAKLTVAAAKVLPKKAKVVSPAMTLRLDSQRKTMVQYFKQKVGGKRVHKYLDAIAIDTFPHQTGTPEHSYALMRKAKKMLARIGVRKPFWNNEINYGVLGGGNPSPTTYPVDVQQSYVIRTYALSAAAGMKRTYWLGWFKTDTMGVHMTDDLGRAAAPATSYSVVRDWLNKTNFRGCKKNRSGLWKCTAKKGRREVRRIYWDVSGTSTVRTPRSTKRVADQEGGVRAVRGRERLTVGYRPVMVASRK